MDDFGTTIQIKKATPNTFTYALKMKHNSKPEQIVVSLDKLGDPINIPVRYSTKAKRIIIKIHHKNAELVLPNHNINAGYKFLLEKESWVRNKLSSSKQNNDSDIDNKIIPILGRQYSILQINAIRNNVHIKDNVIYVESFPYTHNKSLIKFLQDKLLLEITNIVNTLSTQYELKFSKIKITDSKTRWGSCSSNLVLCFNWRLIFAPQEILNYVIIHEMCHLVEMNHSKSFWALVAKLCPKYQAAKSWLKMNGPRLHLYLPA